MLIVLQRFTSRLRLVDDYRLVETVKRYNKPFIY